MRALIAVLSAGLAITAAPKNAQTLHGQSHSHGAAHGQMSPIPDEDTAAIRALLMVMFDRPEARLTVEPVVIVADVALAGWQQEGRGGRALLRRGQTGWYVALCAGPELLDPAFVQGQGLGQMSAARLVSAMRDAEVRHPGLSPLLDTFDTVLMFDEPVGDAHGHLHGHGHGHSHGN